MLTLTQNEKTKFKLNGELLPSTQHISYKFYDLVLVRTEEKEALPHMPLLVGANCYKP